MVDNLFNIYCKAKTAKGIWDALGTKYGTDDFGTNKYTVARWLKFQITDGKPIMDQIHEYENMVSEIIGEGMVLCEYMQANVLIEKLSSPSWDEYKKHLWHKKKDMKLQELIGHIKIEDATRSQDRARTNATNTVKANVVEYRNTGTNKIRSYNQYNKPQNADKSINTMTGNCWWCDKPGHPAFKCKAKKAYEERQQNQGNRINAHGGKFQKKDNNQRGGYKNYKSNKPQDNVVEGSSEGRDGNG
ncbi:uncharacterized protein LOC141648991 [Silene latifolia]|uniref:uncharacterized protein LOC141648991 n=1 Tax=Silene latifolia TaxID=37657 RepID=UPI003D76D74E